MNILVISLNDSKRLSKLNYEYTKIDADDWSNTQPIIKGKMVRKFKEGQKHFNSKCGCFSSHYKTYKYIVENKLNNVIICEDDAILDCGEDFENIGKKRTIRTIMDELKNGGKITLLGAKLLHPTNYRKEFVATNVVAELENGLNTIDKTKFRWSGTWAIFYPTWESVNEIIKEIEKPTTKLNHMDLWLCKKGFITDLFYPSVFTHNDGGTSAFGIKRKIFKNYLAI
tara:strand:- start:84 stop:764 length:681 start_codon:yes stop_codon:yes gene_type:complete